MRLRKMRTKTMARKLVNGKEVPVASNELKIGDCFVCEAGEMIAADGEIVEGIATVDESAITGESAPGRPRKRRRPQRRHRRHEGCSATASSSASPPRPAIRSSTG